MTTHAASAAPLPAWFDPLALARAGSDAPAELPDPATPLAREAWQAGLQALEQQAALANRWLTLWGTHARELGQIAHGAARKAGRLDDGAAVWTSEIEFLQQTAELGSACAQAAWSALLESQSRLATQWVESQGETFRRLLRTVGGNGGARDEDLALDAGAAGNGAAAWLGWVADATRNAQAASEAFVRAATGAAGPEGDDGDASVDATPKAPARSAAAGRQAAARRTRARG